MRAAAVLSCLLLITSPASADDAPRAFKKAWSQAQSKTGEEKLAAEKAALDALGQGGTVACAKLLAGFAHDQRLAYQSLEAAQLALNGITATEVVLFAGEQVEGKARRAERRAVWARYLAVRAKSKAAHGLLLLPALADKDWRVVVAGIDGLKQVKKPAVVSALIDLLGRAEGRVKGDAQRALEALTHQKHTSVEAWKGWWAPRKDGYAFAPPKAEPEPSDEVPGRLRTVARLKPPGDQGKTIYREIESSNVIFVVDFSGSMQVKCQDTSGRSRSRLQYVKQELAAAIEKQLDEKAYFNVIAFSTKVVPWKKKLVKASARNKKSAQRFVRSLRPDGETNIYDSLKLAFAHKRVDTVYFLTDGNPSTGAKTSILEIQGDVRKWNAGRGVRLNTIGFLAGDGKAIGVVENKGMSKRFLQLLAKQNQGSASMFE